MKLPLSGSNSYPIYKSLFDLKTLKMQLKIVLPMVKRKTINNYLKMYSSAIEEAKDYKAKAPKTSNNKDILKAAGSAALTGSSYTSPKQYTTQAEWDPVIKELIECKKYLEHELKLCEAACEYEIESYFDFEFK